MRYEKEKSKILSYPSAFNFLHFQDFLIQGDHKVKNFKRKQPLLNSKKGRLISSRNEAFMLEYIIMLSRHYHIKHESPSFYHSNKRICRDTGFSIGTLKSILNKFEVKLKILKSWKGGDEISGTTIYQLNYKRLYQLMPAIFISDASSHATALPNQLERYKARYSHFVYMHKQQQVLIKGCKTVDHDDDDEDDDYLYD